MSDHAISVAEHNVPVGETSKTIVQGPEEASSSEIKQYEHNVPEGETSESIVQGSEEASSSKIKQYEFTKSREGFEQKITAGVDGPDNDNGYLKMNVNGCIRESTKKAGFGGVFKDAKGAWILGFYGKLQKGCTGLDAEIWSIYRGITIASNRNMTNVEIASDCATAVSIFQGSLDGPSSMLNVITDGIHLMQRGNGRIKHVAREANKVAEAMANLGVDQDEDLNVMTNPPEVVKGLLIDDLKGIGYIKMNVVGRRMAPGFGGVFKDAKGAWILGFYGKLQKGCTGLDAEIWSIYRGITIASNRNMTNVEIASDCATAVSIFQGSLDGPSSMLNVITDGIHLMQRGNGRIKHVAREANKVAEAMANLGVDQDEDLNVMTNPPEVVKGLLIDDLKGIGYIKMNVVGRRMAPGFGGVFKDAKGAWILGFYGKLQKGCTGLDAEIWSIYRGITIASNRNMTNVEIASDCATAVSIFQGSLDGPSSMLNVITDGIHLMQRGNGRIKHVAREANKVAEAMANLGVDQDEDLNVMTNPPEVVKGLLIDDLKGIDPARSRKLAESLTERLSILPRETRPNCYSIFRVPEKLGQLNEKVHTPHLVSIGPLHHGEPELIGMEDYKLRCLQSYLERTILSLESCFTLIQEFIQEAKNRYTEHVGVTDADKFVTMVLVDSCFVIESMIRYREDPAEGGNFHFVRSDMILVGNQLPFFVLDHIYDFAMTFSRYGFREAPTFLELSANYFKTILLISNPRNTTGILKDGVKHLLDLVRLLHLPSERLNSTECPYSHIPTASLLREAGMKFECGMSRPYLDLNYNHNGVLEIPQLLFNNRADLLLINMIALEVNSYLDHSYILDFVVFMDDLISTGKDVDILVESGIIRNYIGESQAIADKFNRLTSQSLIGNYYFGNVSSDVNSFYTDRHNKWRATLKRDYCGSPFKVASVVAATILLVLTFMQTLGTIFGLSKKFAFMLLWITGGSFLSIFGAVVVMNYYSVLLRRMRLRRRRPLPGSP